MISANHSHHVAVLVFCRLLLKFEMPREGGQIETQHVSVNRPRFRSSGHAPHIQTVRRHDRLDLHRPG